jgi:hypothetical protein
MAILNMNQLFDSLKSYIDNRIDSTENGIKELLEEYGVKEVANALPEITTITNNIVEIKLVSHSIYDIGKCADNLGYIKFAPTAAEIAIAKAKEAANSATASETSKSFSQQWSSAPEDTPVDDGINQGYSAFHWSKKAERYDPENFLRVDGSNNMIGHLDMNMYSIQKASGISMYGSTEMYESGVKKANVYATVDGVVTDILTADKAVVNSFRIDQDSECYVRDNKVWHFGNMGPDSGLDADTVDGKEAADFANAVHTHTESEIRDLNKYSKEEFIGVSAGGEDAGKPIVLDANGKIDSSMLDVSVFYYVGEFNPEAC